MLGLWDEGFARETFTFVRLFPNSATSFSLTKGLGLLDRWQAIAKQYESVENMNYDEKLVAQKDIDAELNALLRSLEGEPFDTKFSVLSEICASTFFARALSEARPPSAVAYALISKGLYEAGMCETPERLRHEVEELTDALEEVELVVGIDRHRLPTLKNPFIDHMILEDEFDTTSGGDSDIIDAILANPVSPERLLRAIFEGEFDSSEDYDGFYVLSDLIKHPGTPDEIIKKIALGDYSWDIGGDQGAVDELASLARNRLQELK